MSSHMPPVPPANRSPNGPGSEPAAPKDTSVDKHAAPQNIAEQGETANCRIRPTKDSFAGVA
jgi:hypothetical protein